MKKKTFAVSNLETVGLNHILGLCFTPAGSSLNDLNKYFQNLCGEKTVKVNRKITLQKKDGSRGAH